ncbi:MAG: alkaline phosphatase family protein, partial [Mycobacterium sp.]
MFTNGTAPAFVSGPVTSRNDTFPEVLADAACIPAHTGAAWPSMISGRNPGKHGLFDFERVDVANYACTDGFAT